MSSPYRAGADALGVVVRVHRAASDRFLFGCLTVVAVLAAAAFVVVRNWLGLLAEVAGIGVCVLILRRRRSRVAGQHIALHERGLVQTDGDRTTTIAFDEVESITSDRRVMRSGVRTERHLVRASDGRQIEFTNSSVVGADDLLAEIERQALPRLRTEALRAFDDGKPVVFGPFSLDEDGIRAGDEPRVPWTDVKDAKIEKGMLYVLGRDERSITWRGLSLVPNAAILFEMITLASDLAPEPKGKHE